MSTIPVPTVDTIDRLAAKRGYRRTGIGYNFECLCCNGHMQSGLHFFRGAWVASRKCGKHPTEIKRHGSIFGALNWALKPSLDFA